MSCEQRSVAFASGPQLVYELFSISMNKITCFLHSSELLLLDMLTCMDEVELSVHYIWWAVLRVRVVFVEYRLVAKKGEGTFSEVLKAQYIKNGKYVAIKCMKNHFESLDQVRWSCFLIYVLCVYISHGDRQLNVDAMVSFTNPSPDPAVWRDHTGLIHLFAASLRLHIKGCKCLNMFCGVVLQHLYHR